MKRLKLKIYAPLIFFFTMLLDGQLSSVMENVTKDNYYPISMLTILLFILGTINLSERYMLIVAFAIGFLYDSYFIGVLGINMFLYPFTTYWLHKMRKIIRRNLFTKIAVFIITLTAYQIALMLLQSFFGLAKINLILFIVFVLGPSILFNIFLFMLFVYPLCWLFGVKTVLRKEKIDLLEN